MSNETENTVVHCFLLGFIIARAGGTEPERT